MITSYIGPPYDSVENDDYAQNQRDNGRYPYNRNPGGNGNSGGNDNFRFPPNDNSPQNVRPQVIAANEVIAKVQFY